MTSIVPKKRPIGVIDVSRCLERKNTEESSFFPRRRKSSEKSQAEINNHESMWVRTFRKGEGGRLR